LTDLGALFENLLARGLFLLKASAKVLFAAFSSLTIRTAF